MRRLFKWVAILGILAGLTAAGIIKTKAWLYERSIPRYLTAKISRGRVETVVNSTGTVKPVLSVSVGAFTSGPIKEVLVDFNSVVKKGAILALIDPKLAQAAYDRDIAALNVQKADLTRVEALLKQAESNENRGKRLRVVNKDFLAEIDMDNYHFTRLQFEAQIALGKANIAQATATLQNSKANLAYTEIRSPVDGIVIERKVDPGQTVAASFQTPELFILAPEMDKHMFVNASVDEADIGKIRTAQEHGMVVKFTVDAYSGDLFEGKIHQIRNNSITTQNVVTYPVIIEAPNPGRKLMPGMTANISFPLDAKEDVIRVPAAALRYVPLPVQVRLEDRHYLEALPSSKPGGISMRSATEKADQARKRQHRLLWVQDGSLLRAVPVVLGLIDNQFGELVSGEVVEGQAFVTGTESTLTPR